MAKQTADLMEITDLCVSVGQVQVCSDLSLSITAGSCWGILGANGIGKTTLLHTLAGLAEPAAGRISLQGRSLKDQPRKAIARTLGLLFQTMERGFPASSLETVLTGRHPHLRRWGWEDTRDLHIAHQALTAVGLSGFEERVVDCLSGGERRRVEIATLLAQRPLLALLDEPSNHLDLGQQIAMLDLLKHRFSTDGRAMVMVLHDINHALRYCDHLLLLKGNGQWLSGKTADMVTAENMQQLFGHPLVRLQGPHGPILVPG